MSYNRPSTRSFVKRAQKTVDRYESGASKRTAGTGRQYGTKGQRSMASKKSGWSVRGAVRRGIQYGKSKVRGAVRKIRSKMGRKRQYIGPNVRGENRRFMKRGY